MICQPSVCLELFRLDYLSYSFTVVLYCSLHCIDVCIHWWILVNVPYLIVYRFRKIVQEALDSLAEEMTNVARFFAEVFTRVTVVS